MPRKNEVTVKAPPRKLNLKRYVDFKEEARRFELPAARVAEIADEIVEAKPPLLEVTITKSESELRERLEEIYNIEAEKFSECPFNGCMESFSEIHQLIAHQRLHLAMSSPDFRVRVGVLRDIERTLVPKIDTSVTERGALPPEERRRLLKLLPAKGLLPAGSERSDNKPSDKDQ